ncbi:hypothetical protein N7925_18305 [Streptomyces sp. CA-278952]|uniref:hypothetical protein n=1 Tax=Streptomyces sp. CA-278952 TaxID=2980556 RepID=UPI002368758B|nr:hypothetical protein [Streptomyces sp. CA-278952]WDG30155.1 hypothetical protein N7925_18305 [Streptomyces sp. CA-278952]
MAAAGAALGPLGGSAHGSPAPASPPHSATPPTPGTSSPAATPSAAPARPAAPRPVPSGSASPSALPSALPGRSGVPVSGTPGSGPDPSSPATTGHGAQAPAGPGSDSPDSASSSPSASPGVSGSTAPLAGREAGAGKARPGRSLTPLELARADEPVPEDEPDADLVEPVDLPGSAPPPSAFTDPGPRSGQALDAASVQRIQQVSLGTGIALVGLGLGFLAFRMRQAN